GRPGTQPGRPRWYLNYPLRRGITFTIFRYPLRCLVNFAQTGISAATYRHFPPLPAISRHQHGFRTVPSTAPSRRPIEIAVRVDEHAALRTSSVGTGRTSAKVVERCVRPTGGPRCQFENMTRT